MFRFRLGEITLDFHVSDYIALFVEGKKIKNTKPARGVFFDSDFSSVCLKNKTQINISLIMSE